MPQTSLPISLTSSAQATQTVSAETKTVMDATRQIAYAKLVVDIAYAINAYLIRKQAAEIIEETKFEEAKFADL